MFSTWYRVLYSHQYPIGHVDGGASLTMCSSGFSSVMKCIEVVQEW